MEGIAQYRELFGKDVTVICEDGTAISGYWSEWFSAEDNSWDEDGEPRSESVLIDTSEGAPTEIYVEEIKSIEAV